MLQRDNQQGEFMLLIKKRRVFLLQQDCYKAWK